MVVRGWDLGPTASDGDEKAAAIDFETGWNYAGGLTNVKTVRIPNRSCAAGDARAFRHRFELRPHDRWMHAPVDFLLREAAVGAGNQVLAPHARGEPRETL